MKTWMILLLTSLFLLPMAAGSLAAWPPLAERVHTKETGDTVNVGIDTGDDPPGVPLNALLHALVAYPQAHRFRVSWTNLVLTSATSVTAIYDRSKHSVTLYQVNSEGDNNGRISGRQRLRYTGVQEKDFGLVAAAHKGDTAGSSGWNWFDDLSKYGCWKHNLSAR
jgi:hypothetical protein